ncbi:phospholipase A2-like [Uloborus diversus]|uniref:phospholipase A2-like n=1 Tax=Uloborus diversus TaxID=327109 RepID=UPI002408FA87|nr:phospholipase A2-like [Uloborus diversus]
MNCFQVFYSFIFLIAILKSGNGLILKHSNAFGITRPTAADKLVLLQRDELKFLLRLKTQGTPQSESKEYKCHILSALYQSLSRSLQPSPDHSKLIKRIHQLSSSCSKSNFRMAEFFNQSYIFPGTKWCGQGNVAENFHDLGVFNGSDACCREHDFCDDVINAGRTKHDLVNPYGTTRLHCKCDEDLRQCFRKINSVIANTIGYIFFSLLQTQCFDFDHPAIGCETWKRGAVRQYCVKYKLLKDEPKRWQWFDQEPYF